MFSILMHTPPGPDSISDLMAAFRKGDRKAADRLVEMLYPELRRLAASKMRGERTEHTWQPTLLVNELYLALVKIKALGGGEVQPEQEKAAFLGLAGNIMKRLLIDHARPLHKRTEKVELRETHADSSDAAALQDVELALSRLGAIDPKLRFVIEMRVFEGLTVSQVAEQLHCSPRTIANYWTFARRWLGKELVGSVAL